MKTVFRSCTIFLHHSPRRTGMIITSPDPRFWLRFFRAQERHHYFVVVVPHAIYYQILNTWNIISHVCDIPYKIIDNLSFSILLKFVFFFSDHWALIYWKFIIAIVSYSKSAAFFTDFYFLSVANFWKTLKSPVEHSLKIKCREK